MLKPCWADKTALGLFALGALFLLFLGSIGPNPNAGSADWFDAYGVILWHVGLKLALPFWILLRFVDLLIGGPRRRSGWITVKPVDHP